MSNLPGSDVTVRGERWTVLASQQFPSCTIVELEGRDATNAGRRCRVVAPFDQPRVGVDRLRRRRRDVVLRGALLAVANERLPQSLWTAATARFDVLAYQLEPALAVIGGATRLLLADEVGLGKTVQAGVILSELMARGLVERALILTPVGLRDTWANELRSRFDLHARVVDHASLSLGHASLPASVNPWALTGITIASLDFAKRPEHLAAVEEAPYDLLIADEAHHLTPGSDRGRAVERLAARVPWVVLVSATPHSGDDTAFRFLTGLGAAHDSIAIFRRRRDEVGRSTRRRRHWLAVKPHPLEATMLAGVEAYARRIWQARGATDRGARLLAITLARRGASSAAALCLTLQRRLDLLSRREPTADHPTLPWDEVDDDDAGEGAWLGAPGLWDTAEEQRWLEQLIAASGAARVEASTVRRLVRWLARAREPAVIFTEFRDTLEAIGSEIERVRAVAVIHGGLSAAHRQCAVDRFTRGAADVLLATDAAGEGLNLHHRCRLVVNVDLPWNPIRLEQRIGRVDRIGQRQPVHAVHLFHPTSIEARVLAALDRRRVAAEGEWGTSEDDVAAEALADARVDARASPALRLRHVDGAHAEAERIVWQRHCLAENGRGVSAIGWAAPARRRPFTDRVVLLFVLHRHDGEGRLVSTTCVPVEIELTIVPRSRRQWLRVLAELTEDADVRLLQRASDSRTPAANATVLAGPARSRIATIRGRLSSAPRRLTQPSLFDRRAWHEAELRRHVALTLDDHLDRRARQLTALMEPAAHASARLIAAWPAHRSLLSREK